MTDVDKDEQRERFREAVDRKNEDAERRSRERGADGGLDTVGGVTGKGGDQESLYEQGRPQDTLSPREKNSRKGKVTADKWNQ